MNSPFRDLLKFCEQQETYLIMSIRVSDVIEVGGPLKPTTPKTSLFPHHPLLSLLTQGLCQVREAAKKLIHILHYCIFYQYRLI